MPVVSDELPSATEVKPGQPAIDSGDTLDVQVLFAAAYSQAFQDETEGSGVEGYLENLTTLVKQFKQDMAIAQTLSNETDSPELAQAIITKLYSAVTQLRIIAGLSVFSASQILKGFKGYPEAAPKIIGAITEAYDSAVPEEPWPDFINRLVKAEMTELLGENNFKMVEETQGESLYSVYEEENEITPEMLELLNSAQLPINVFDENGQLCPEALALFNEEVVKQYPNYLGADFPDEPGVMAGGTYLPIITTVEESLDTGA